MLWLLWEKSCFQELQEEKRMKEMQGTTPYPSAHRCFTLMKESNAEEETTEKPIRVNNACTDIPQNGTNQEIVLQAVTPVLVTNKANNKQLKTYALYDNGSVGCFLTENL